MNHNIRCMAVFLGISMLTNCSVVSDRETLGEYVDDTGVTAKVKTAILNDAELAPFQIHVETFQGTVQLSGFVETSQQASKAEQIARKTKGVHTVKNSLIVRSISK